MSMTFGDAIEALKAGKRAARSGWNGKGMWLALVRVGGDFLDGLPVQDCIGMRTADAKFQPGWLASQADMLASDWAVVAA